MEWTEKEFRKIYMELSKKLLEFYSPAWVAAGRPVAAYSPDFVLGWTTGRKGFRVGLPGDATNLSSPLEQWCLDLAYTSRHSITMADGDIFYLDDLHAWYRGVFEAFMKFLKEIGIQGVPNRFGLAKRPARPNVGFVSTKIKILRWTKETRLVIINPADFRQTIKIPQETAEKILVLGL